MHDLDRTWTEFEEYDVRGNGNSDFEFEEDWEGGIDDQESPFDEGEELELAAELLEVSSDEELEEFINSKLFKKWGKKAKKFMSSRVGRKLGGMLKGLAKKALPLAGTAIGTYFGGPAGAALGGKVGSMATKFLGAELEGLEPDELEYEVARRFVRLAGTAASKAAAAPPSSNPKAAAYKALTAAARLHAPGLVGKSETSSFSTNSNEARSGRWIRRGNRIILMGV
ncbi:MAG: hypothetical protein AB1545_05335 [Thermodesulfobacteriota bacterium]